MPKANGTRVPLRREKAARTASAEREVLAISKALSGPRRFAANSYMACSDLRGAFPITPATLSHHLKELESCGLIETARRGKFVDLTFCRPAMEGIFGGTEKSSDGPNFLNRRLARGHHLDGCLTIAK